MATCRVSGFELVEQQLNRMGRPMIRQIVEAGAKAAEKVMADATEEKGHIRTGEMMRSIGHNEYREFLGGGSTDVYPQGDDTEEHGHVGPRGEMLKSIGTNEYREFLNGGSVDVYPQGDDSKGARNATKAYVINYGKGKRPNTKWPKKHPRRNRTGDKFITGNEGKTEAAVTEAMQAESDRLIAEL